MTVSRVAVTAIIATAGVTGLTTVPTAAQPSAASVAVSTARLSAAPVVTKYQFVGLGMARAGRTFAAGFTNTTGSTTRIALQVAGHRMSRPGRFRFMHPWIAKARVPASSNPLVTAWALLPGGRIKIGIFPSKKGAVSLPRPGHPTLRLRAIRNTLGQPAVLQVGWWKRGQHRHYAWHSHFIPAGGTVSMHKTLTSKSRKWVQVIWKTGSERSTVLGATIQR